MCGRESEKSEDKEHQSADSPERAMHQRVGMNFHVARVLGP